MEKPEKVMNIQEALSVPLPISDIDFRVQSINKGGYATILAYKDARVDMKRLDEVCGVFGWQREYTSVNGVTFCGVSIYNHETQQWVIKWDAGVKSMADGDKGEASDAFKRACFNWGLGRELYDYPVIQIKLNPNEFKVEGNKVKQTYELKLKAWVWFSQFQDGKLMYLGAKDEKGKVRFQYGTYTQPKLT
jgi:hypothetical protein